MGNCGKSQTIRVGDSVFHRVSDGETAVLYCGALGIAVSAASDGIADEGSVAKAALGLPAPHRPPESKARLPYLRPNLNLVLTEKCQLACTYCYSQAHDEGHSISREKAFAAIDVAFKNARLLNVRTGRAAPVSIGFTGGGEPTVEMDVMLACLEYASEKSRSSGAEFHCSLQTNGQFDPSYIPKLKQMGCRHIAFSIDGVRDVQDRQRPRADGGSSFERCVRAMRSAESEGLPFSVRSTVTSVSLHRLNDFFQFLDNEFACDISVSIDTISLSGRGANKQGLRPTPEAFAKVFAELRGAPFRKVHLVNHYANLERYSHFCGAMDKAGCIYVSPSELVSTCQETCERHPVMGDDHIVGAFSDGRFVFRQAGRESRWARASSGEPCKSCIALSFCAGGCRTKISSVPPDPFDEEAGYWCELTRRLAEVELLECARNRSLYPTAQRMALDNVEGARDPVTAIVFHRFS